LGKSKSFEIEMKKESKLLKDYEPELCTMRVDSEQGRKD